MESGNWAKLPSHSGCDVEVISSLWRTQTVRKNHRSKSSVKCQRTGQVSGVEGKKNGQPSLGQLSGN